MRGLKFHTRVRGGRFSPHFLAEAAMRLKSLLMVGLVLTLSPKLVHAQQRMIEREQEFLRSKPKINDVLTDVTVYDVEGREVKTSSLRGHYTVLTFGCLT